MNFTHSLGFHLILTAGLSFALWCSIVKTAHLIIERVT